MVVFAFVKIALTLTGIILMANVLTGQYIPRIHNKVLFYGQKVVLAIVIMGAISCLWL